MTDPLEQDVLSFLGGYKPPAAKPVDPLEEDVHSFLSSYKPPPKKVAAPVAPKPPVPTRDPILDRLPPALAADFEKRPEFAAKLAADRAAGLTDDQIVAKIAAGQRVKPKRPAWAADAPSTAEASNDALYGQPSGMETAVEAGLRGVAAAKGNVGALMERFGQKAALPPEDPKMDAAHEEALAKARAIYSVGTPGVSLTPVAETIARPVIENVMQPMVEKGQAIQRESEAEQQALPRPKYARNFVDGLKTDPFKTLAISGIENLPQLATTLGAAAVSPELGLGVAWAQETGGAYQEAKQRGATEEEAQAISGVVGATNMFLEYLPAGKALETLGGATRSGVKGFLYDLLEQAVSEGATESIQEANQMVVTAAMSAHDQGFTFDQFRDRVLEAGLSAFVLGGVTGAAAHVGGSLRGADPAGLPAAGTIESPAPEQVVEEPPPPAPAAAHIAAIPADEPVVVSGETQQAPDALAPSYQSPALTPRVPRWAANMSDASARFKDFLRRHQGRVLAPEDLPFELVNLPLMRWERASGAVNPDRGGHFWTLGDSTLYHSPGGDQFDEGGPNPRATYFTPSNPLIIARRAPAPGKSWRHFEGALVRSAIERGHDSIIFPRGGRTEVITLPGAELTDRPIPPLNPETRIGLGNFIDFPNPVDAVLGDPRAANLFKRMAPAIRERALRVAEEVDGSGSLPRLAAMSDAELEADVNDFLSKREAPDSDAVAAQKADFADLAAASLAIGSSKEAGVRGPVEIVPGSGTGVNRQLLAVDQAGNEAGSLDYTVEPDGFRVHMIATGQRGSGAGRALMQAAAEDANGPMTGAASMTPEGEGFFRRIAETDPGLVSESVFAKEAPDAGSTLAAPEQGGGPGVAAQGVRDNGRGEGMVPGPARVATEGALNAVQAIRGSGAPEGGSREARQSEAGEGLREGVGEPVQADPSALDRRARETPVNQTAAPEPRAQEPPLSGEDSERVADEEPASQAPEPAVEPTVAEAVPEPAPERDRGPESLPARLVRPRQAAGQEGFAVLPSAIKKPLMDWVKKRLTQQGLAPAYYLDLKIKRDNQLAAKAARLDAYSIDLARAIRRYKGPLTPAQLKVYLDDAYRGMNLSGISGPMDETQVARIKERRQLSEVAAQRLREESSPGGLKSAPEFMLLLREMRAAQDDIARTLRRQGLLDDASIQQLEREFGLYVHRQYEAARNPKYLKWVKKQPLWNRAYDLTKGLWDRQFAADRAEMIVDDLKLRRPPGTGPLQQGDRVRRGDGGPVGTIVQVNPDTGQGHMLVAGEKEAIEAPLAEFKRARGTKAQAVADVKRAMMDPSTRDQFLADYGIDAAKFDASHDKAKTGLPDMPENEIWGMLHSYVESSGNRPVLPGGVPEGSKDMSSLKRRGRKDDLERLLKSEVRSVDWNFLTTTLKMATIVAQHRFLVDLERAGKGDIFVEKPEVRNAGTDQEQSLTKPVDPGFYAKSIENAKGREPGIDQRIIMQGNKKMAPLSDLFTTDEMMEALNQAFDQKSNPAWLRWYMRGVITAKGAATAQSLISLMRNVWSQPLAVAANGVNPFNLRRFAEAGKLAYPRAVGSTDRTRLARMERYIELGIVDQGTDVGDIKRMERRAHVLREDIPHGAGHLGGRIIREGSRGVMKLYEAPDNQGKIEVFEALLPLYKKAFPEMTTREVEEHLAAKQRNTMQNYSMTPPLVKDVSQFPFIGSFVSFRMESVRNLYHAIRVAAEETQSDNPELKKIGLRRAAGIAFALTSTGMVAFALRHWNNMDDDDDDAVRRFMAPWNKNSQVAFLHSVDENGDVAFIDLSFMDYYSAVKTPFHALLRGDLAGVRDSILDPFGEDVFTKNVMDIWARGGKTKDGFDVYNKQDSTLTKSIEIAKHLGAPLTPGVIKQVARVLDPERDKSTEILGLAGVRKTVVNVPKELRRQAKMFADAINDSRWIEKKVIRKPGTEEAYAEAQRRSEVALRRNIEEFIGDIQAARQLGLPESEIAEALIESGFSKGNPAKGKIGDAGLLLGGEVDALVERYQDLNEKWGEEKRSNATSDNPIDSTGFPWRLKKGETIIRSGTIEPGDRPETALQRANRERISKAANEMMGRAVDREMPWLSPNAQPAHEIAAGLIGQHIRRSDDKGEATTALGRVGRVAREKVRTSGPAMVPTLKNLSTAGPRRRMIDWVQKSFTTESPRRRAEIIAATKRLMIGKASPDEVWDQVRAMFDYKAAPGE